MADAGHLRCAVIEDNHDLNSMLVEDIRTASYCVRGFVSVEEFITSEFDPQIIILDINLPGKDGFEFMVEFRKHNRCVQVIALSARSGVENRVAGYRSGIDNYLEKPVSSLELLAVLQRCSQRIEYLCRNADLPSRHAPMVLQGCELTCAGSRINLNERERAFLLALVCSENQRLSYLDCKLACSDIDMKQSALEVFVGRYRRKLKDAFGVQGAIRSVRGWGYQLTAPVECGEGTILESFPEASQRVDFPHAQGKKA